MCKSYNSVPPSLTGSSLSIRDERYGDISHYIITQQWTKLRKALEPEKLPPYQKVPLDEKISPRSCLHLACRFNPPLDSIIALDMAHPESIKHCSCVGKFPIHFAAEWGASPSVIEYLALKKPSSVGFQDFSGRTSLHYACEHYAKRCLVKSSGSCANEQMLDVVKMLCRAAPTSVNIEDSQGMNALEYAIDSGADYKVVSWLQKKCAREWDRKRKEGFDHASIEDKLAGRFELCKEVTKRMNAVTTGKSLVSEPVPQRDRRQSFVTQERSYSNKAIAA